MLHILSYSGGKDSTALAVLLKERMKVEFTPVFCDTGWEHPLTYAYIEYMNKEHFQNKLVTLRSEKWGGMRELVVLKKRIPSAKARFCTEKLKVEPMIKYLQSLDDEYIVYQGIRAEESPSRAKMPQREWSDAYDCYVERPLLRWTAAQVFDLLKQYNVYSNPLYEKGAGRVGCFPCVLVNHGELKRLTTSMPEIWDRARELEKIAGRSFFPPNMIPARFHSGYDPNSEKTFPTVDDVQKYIISRHDIDIDEPAPQCMSIYNLCE